MMHKDFFSFFRKYACSLCIIFSLVPSLHAQTRQPGKLFVNYDIARFRNTSDRGYLEFYFGFSPHNLLFQRRGEKLQGGLSLAVRLREMKSNNLVIQKKYFFPVQFADTINIKLNRMIVSQGGYEIPFGIYRLEIFAADSLDGARLDSSVINDIEISSFKNDICSSDLELCSSITSSRDTTDSFYKNSLEVVPNPSLVFGSSNYPVLCHYLELYNLNKDSLYTIEATVIDQGGTKRKSSVKQKHYGVKNAVEVGTMTMTNLPSGKYLYRVRILNGEKNEIMAVQKYFFTNNPHVTTVANPISMKAAEFLGMSYDELSKEFRTARYLANDQEIKSFSKITTVEGQQEFLSRFWTNVEHGQSGCEPISRKEYLHRVNIADERYHGISREGWQTDRGRVYILYAEPDEVERFPSSNDAKPYEIWHYNQIENGIIFVFIDRTGFGEYMLVHSTKRGELQDDQWQRNLQ